MADVRCPMCGKTNPPELETCQYCQARLKPLHVSSSEAGQPASPPSPPPSGSEDQDLPEWLRNLRQRTASDSEPGQQTGALPDWLRGGSEASDLPAGAEAHVDEPAGDESDAGLPDWLANMRASSGEGDSAPATPPFEPPDLDSTELDWLRSASPPGPPPASNDDWLASIRSSTPGAPVEPPTMGGRPDNGRLYDQGPDEERLEDERLADERLADERLEDERPEHERPEDALPDWLQRMSAESSAASDQPFSDSPASPEPAQSPAAEEAPPGIAPGELPDWLAQFAPSPAENAPTPPSGSLLPPSTPEPSESAPDWLAPGESGSKDEPLASGDLPDWLAQLSPQQEQPPDSSPASSSVAESGVSQDRASAGSSSEESHYEESPFEGGASEGGASEGGASKGSPTGGLTDWLAQFSAPEPPAPGLGDDSASPFAGEELPDWLKSIAPGTEIPMGGWAQVEEGDRASSNLEPMEELPDWMANLVAGGQPPAPGEEPQEEETLSASSADQPAPPGEAPETGPAAGAFVSPFTSGEEGGEAGDLFATALPDWLSTMGSPEEAGPAETEPPLETPGSLSPARGAFEFETPGDGGRGEGPDVSGLAPAELPSWLEAMRPEDVPQEFQGQPEAAGPLAGLRGLLPAEPEVTQVRKPPASPSKLEVSPEQQAHAELLAAMLKSEEEVQPLPRRQVLTPQHLLRIAIFFLLLLAVGFALAAGDLPISPPELGPETLAAYEAVQALPSAGAPVLLVMDYSPATAGEMEAALSPVLDHLMLKGAYLALVSTFPTGPVQAESLIARANAQGQHTYAPEGVVGGQLQANQYANLGYLSGGASGLLSFTEYPQQALPYSLAGPVGILAPLSAWSQGPLQAVSTLADFSLVVVATDNPNTARLWVEQVQPKLVTPEETTPLVMVTSAQAAPLLRPYAEGGARQLQGVVSGVMGGMNYLRSTGRQGIAQAYWSPFSLGLLVTILLVLFGGLMNAITGVWSRRRDDAAGEA